MVFRSPDLTASSKSSQTAPGSQLARELRREARAAHLKSCSYGRNSSNSSYLWKPPPSSCCRPREVAHGFLPRLEGWGAGEPQLAAGSRITRCRPNPRWRCWYPYFTDEAPGLREAAELVRTAQPKALREDAAPASQRQRQGTPKLRGTPTHSTDPQRGRPGPQWPPSLPEGASSLIFFPPPHCSWPGGDSWPLTSPGSWALLMLFQRKAKTKAFRGSLNPQG